MQQPWAHFRRMQPPWRWLPAYAINGIEVALGISAIQLLAASLLGAHAAALVVSGAVCVSIADLPNAVSRTAHRVGAAAVLAAATALLVGLLRPDPLAMGAAVMAITCVAMLTLAWGPRAGAVSFAPLLALVFAMAVPASGHPLANAGFSACGSLAFVAWALLANHLLQRRYRSLALVQALRAAAALFASRADVMAAVRSDGDKTADDNADSPAENSAPMRAWISDEATLADRLQTARDLLFAAPASTRNTRDVALLLRVIDLRDVLLASRLDADLLGHDSSGAQLRSRTAAALRGIGHALAAAAGHVQFGSRPAPTAAAAQTAQTAPAPAFADIALPPGDARQRLLPSLAGRLRQLDVDLARIDALLRGQPEALPLDAAQLQQFVGAEGWPLRALRAHRTLQSPVLRHALRMSLALGTAYFLALALPWGAHPYWLILSVAVVLRGNLGDTLARRNARVLGTVLGCLLVVALSHLPLPGLLRVLFVVALGTAHAFALQRYWLTATAASVMALLQSHLVNPGGGFAIAERVADTLLGALLAWCFSYVLPSWERRSVPQAIQRVQADLAGYAMRALQAVPADAVALRLARRQAYDALSALAAALQRSRAEPRGVRLPAAPITRLLDHGERLMAHLSMVRLMTAQLDNAPAVDSRAAAQVLQAAASDVQAAMLATDRAAASPQAPTLEPDTPPAHNLLPWLTRRLALLVLEAQQVRAAALAATKPR